MSLLAAVVRAAAPTVCHIRVPVPVAGTLRSRRALKASFVAAKSSAAALRPPARSRDSLSTSTIGFEWRLKLLRHRRAIAKRQGDQTFSNYFQAWPKNNRGPKL